MKTATVADFIRVMESVAPSRLAEHWDNPGLQIGNPARAVHAVWVALDPTVPVVSAAVRNNVDLLITHHPLLIRPVSSIHLQTPFGRVVRHAVAHELAVFSAHTNLDAVSAGINDMLAQKLLLRDVAPLVAAGQPQESSSRIEAHGMGRIGNLQEEMALDDFAGWIKDRMNLEGIRVVGDGGVRVRRVAVCCGSGSGVLEHFFSSDAQVFVSGDLKYHDARNAEAVNRALIDIGHFASERIMIDALCATLQEASERLGYDAHIQACQLEKDPFRTR